MVMKKTRYLKSKVCPYCSVPLSLDAGHCFSCRQKVGKANKYGIAERPANFWSYIVCLFSWVGYYLYMRWAFF